jgi:glycosyltransferase involved in cell wall biosynthesis
MKLALVTETYPPEVNGVAMTLSRLVAGLVERGHEVDVVRPRQKAELTGPERRVELLTPRAGLTERRVPGVPIPFYDTLRMGLPVRARLKRLWAEQRPDVVHVATEGPLGLAAVGAAGALGLPVTSSFHTNFHTYGGHYGLSLLRGVALAYLRWFHNRTCCTLVPTGRGAEELAATGFERTGVMARGVDAALFSPERRDEALRREWGAEVPDPVIGYVGRIAAEKNLGLAVEAFLAVRAQEPRARFVLVGDGPERAALAKRHPEFVWAGVRRGEDLARHYASTDLFVFPSVTETFGNVVTEALASGLVVLAYDYASTREHVRNGVNGYAVSFGDRQAYVKAAVEAWEQRGRWPALRQEARRTALGLSWDAVVERFETVLTGALGGSDGCTGGRRGHRGRS